MARVERPMVIGSGVIRFWVWLCLQAMRIGFVAGKAYRREELS